MLKGHGRLNSIHLRVEISFIISAGVLAFVFDRFGVTFPVLAFINKYSKNGHLVNFKSFESGVIWLNFKLYIPTHILYTYYTGCPTGMPREEKVSLL